MSDNGDYDDDTDKKKKKEKKDKKDKDKGYAALAGESSHDEEDAGDSKSPGKKILKGFILSSKKKDKDKEEKKEKKEKPEKLKKRSDSSADRKSSDRESSSTPFSSISSVRIPFSAERHRDINAHRASVPSAFFSSSSGFGSGGSTKEKSKEKDSSDHGDKPSVSALNAFLNAPAPLFLTKRNKDKDKDKVKDKDKEAKKEKKEKESSKDGKKESKDKDGKKDKKDKEHKDKKEHASGVAKVKLKLMRSKNSLDDPHEKGDLHVSVSHQFPEDPEMLAKEIKKYEQLLDDVHKNVQTKSSKKVSKKQEETLWEYQRTLTQLKRKLRSINALSCVSTNMSFHHGSIPKDGFDQQASTSASALQSTIPPPAAIEKSANKSPHPSEETSGSGDSSQTIKSTVAAAASKLSELALTSDPSDQPTKSKSPEQAQESPPKDTNVVGAVGVSEAIQIPKKSNFEQEKITSAADTDDIPTPTAPRKSARRSLDFSGITVSNEKQFSIDSGEFPEGSELQMPSSKSREEFQFQMSPDDKLESPPPQEREREKVEVHVLVHNESRDEDDVSSEADEALPSISSRNEENIGYVVADANAMIGSMHEELEAAALVFGKRKMSREEATAEFVFKGSTTILEGGTHIHSYSKSEPTFGDHDHDQGHDSSDIELIRDDNESIPEDLIPEVMSLPIFETPEYLTYENEQLALFNIQIQEDIATEEAELDRLMEELENMPPPATESENGRPSSNDESEMDHLITVWRVVKTENETLQDNVARLRQMVTLSRLEEFKLEARLRYLEDKVIPVSPITATTPLHSET